MDNRNGNVDKYHEMLKILVGWTRAREKDHAVIQIRKAVESGLQEIEGPMRLHSFAHLEDFKDEGIFLAAIRRIRKKFVDGSRLRRGLVFDCK